MKDFFQKYVDYFCNDVIRIIPQREKAPVKTLYLSFDDGPDPLTTPQLLKFLASKNVKASFFVVANKAELHPHIVGSILEAGHSIGNHSLDHTYSHFFTSQAKLKTWIAASQKKLEKLCGRSPIGFRSPAGVRTPKLHGALKELNIPLIHWDIRYFDTVFSLTKEKVDRSLNKVVNGSIILLHEGAGSQTNESFFGALSYLIDKARDEGYLFSEIPTQVIT